MFVCFLLMCDIYLTYRNIDVIYRIQIAYDMLSDNMKDIEDREDVKKMSDRLLQSIKSLQDTITKIQAPNMKVKVICHLPYSIHFVYRILRFFLPLFIFFHTALFKFCLPHSFKFSCRIL